MRRTVALSVLIACLALTLSCSAVLKLFKAPPDPAATCRGVVKVYIPNSDVEQPEKLKGQPLEVWESWLRVETARRFSDSEFLQAPDPESADVVLALGLSVSATGTARGGYVSHVLGPEYPGIAEGGEQHEEPTPMPRSAQATVQADFLLKVRKEDGEVILLLGATDSELIRYRMTALDNIAKDLVRIVEKRCPTITASAGK
jgi:hypothetical protein